MDTRDDNQYTEFVVGTGDIGSPQEVGDSADSEQQWHAEIDRLMSNGFTYQQARDAIENASDSEQQQRRIADEDEDERSSVASRSVYSGQTSNSAVMSYRCVHMLANVYAGG
jgi:hypothetical protein